MVKCPMPLRDAALLILGHGSTLNADSSAPTYQHAEEIRRRGTFAEVQVAFWKEEPNFGQALRQTSCRQVYVVPNFISSGYFTEQIIPRELGLTGPVTRTKDHEIFYCEPVGLHASMTEALLQRAQEVVAASAESISDPAKTACLFICGHGTSFNDNSTKIIHEQAQLIRARGLYADCQPVLMEQKPFVKEWRTLTDCPDVIVVPFFISDGLHSFEDIPVLLGLTHNVREKAFANPHREGVRRLWYATAIGTEKSVADVILAQVHQFQDEHREIKSTDGASTSPPDADRNLDRMLPAGTEPWKLGEVVVRRGENGSFQLMHEADREVDPVNLHPLNSEEDLRELIRLDADGNFRPLRAAPNLRRGWIFYALDRQRLQLAFDYLYPAALANALLRLPPEALPVIPWNQTAERQTGRFRIVREIDDTAILDLVADICQPGCLKKRLWPPASQSIETEAREIPILCPEACNYLIGKAREKWKGPGEE
jgi:sirohydrochlorin cobaltochelatase